MAHHEPFGCVVVVRVRHPLGKNKRFINLKSMDWRIFKKIKAGIKKVIVGIKKGAQWLGNNALKTIINAVAPVLDQIKPGVGTALQTGVNTLTNLTTGKFNSPKIRLRGYQ